MGQTKSAKADLSMPIVERMPKGKIALFAHLWFCCFYAVIFKLYLPFFYSFHLRKIKTRTISQ